MNDAFTLFGVEWMNNPQSGSKLTWEKKRFSLCEFAHDCTNLVYIVGRECNCKMHKDEVSSLSDEDVHPSAIQLVQEYL